MRKYLAALVLLSMSVRPAFALNETPHFLGLDPGTHACAILTVPTEGWKILGTYKTTKAAQKAMKKATKAKVCYSQPV